MDKTCFPWADWFRLGIDRFALAPQQFWQLSLTEWRWLLAGHQAHHQSVPDQLVLAELLKHYPDEKHG